jgi:hypothetical protein
MCRAALILALGFVGMWLSASAQQPDHSRAAERNVATSVKPIEPDWNLSLYEPKILNVANSSLLFHNGPVRAWSDGAQLASENALAEIGMAPLGLFPVAYLAPNDVGATPTRKATAHSDSRSESAAMASKDLRDDMLGPPLDPVYYTGEVGFVYGQWSGKGSGDYLESYVWGQAGNNKFQITAGAAFENWNGNSPKFRGFPVSR